MFNITTLEENKCIPRRGGEKSKSIVANIINVQTRLRKELDAMVAVVAQKDIETTMLKVASTKEIGEGIRSLGKLSAENTGLCTKVKKLEEKFEILTGKNEDLT